MPALSQGEHFAGCGHAQLTLLVDPILPVFLPISVSTDLKLQIIIKSQSIKVWCQGAELSHFSLYLPRSTYLPTYLLPHGFRHMWSGFEIMSCVFVVESS